MPPAAAEVPDATIAVVNITSPAQSASCLAFEESPGVELPESPAAEPDPALVQPVGAEAEPQNESAVQATQEEKKRREPGRRTPGASRCRFS
jgi:hypothetical protein